MLLFMLFTGHAFAQSAEEYWLKWNKNYPQVDIVAVLDYEQHYADSIEHDSTASPYYSRLAKYRFQAEYLGQTRSIDKDVYHSMRNVFKFFIGDPSQLDHMCDHEVLFRVGDDDLWMPIQPQILKALKEESKKGERFTIYCLYFNEHTSRQLYNTFLISEFTK
jgi:hypothetical protein